ncbi:MAG TPA: STAS domain-containing protein [Polyangium sp.]|nr:STAS domain-containing protein [Polyangium sp.]
MNERPSITVNNVPIAWDPDAGDVTFFGISSVLFWANPSMFRMLEPLVEEIGVDLFRMLVAHSSSLGTDEDYNSMVTALGKNFQEGFLAWGRAVGAAGWGSFELPHFDIESCTAEVRVVNPWELRMQTSGGRLWGCPFLQGKVIGILEHALGQRCWADEDLDIESNPPVVTFSVRAWDRTLNDELKRLRAEQIRAAEARLSEQVESAAAALREKHRELDEKDAIIRSLSSPILQVWDGVLVVPIVGALSAKRAELLNANLLSRVVDQMATHVVLDLTGLDTVDNEVAERLGSTVTALKLLGTECSVVGLSPEFARRAVELDISFGGVQVLRTLADALRDVVGLRRPTQKGRKH